MAYLVIPPHTRTSISQRMRSSPLLGVVAVALCVALVAGTAVVSPVSTQYKAEPQHSLHPPLDHSQVYWNFGGSSVLTKKFIRMTPATQGVKGWIWNEYPLVC